MNAKLATLGARVIGDPDDDALRAVWGDALLEHGDPLGELISLQLAGRDQPLTAAQDKRIRALVSKHRVGWLGKLAPIVQHREGMVFDRGLVSECHIQVKKLAALAAAVGDPGWVAVRRMWFCDRFAWDPRIVPLLVHPIMRSLREVFTIGMDHIFPLLARHHRALPFTSLWLIDDSERDPPQSIRDVTATPGLPNLARLGFSYTTGEYVLTLPIIRRISTFGLINREPAGRWLAATERLDNLTTLELRPFWIPIPQGGRRPHFVLSFTRASDGQWRELTIIPVARPHAAMVVDQLASISGATLAKISAPAALKPQLRKFRRAEIEWSEAPLAEPR